MLLCNYSIINFDDMLPVWEELGATVVHNVTGEQFLFSEPAAPAHDTDDEPDDEEFDRLLEEFIAGCSEEEQKEEEKGEDSESVSEEDWDEDEPDEEDEPAAPVKEPVPNASSFEVETVKTCRIYPSGKGGKKEGMPLKTFALRHLERIEFCVDFSACSKRNRQMIMRCCFTAIRGEFCRTGSWRQQTGRRSPTD